MAVTEEKLIEVQKNYSEEVISEIQHAIDTNSASIQVLTSIDELPKTIYIDGVKVCLTHDTRYDVIMYCDDYHDASTGAKWKTEPIYKFYFKDWKRLNKDINIFENNNYIEVTFKVKDVDVIALLRRIDIELAEDSFLLMEYDDINYDNAQYAIIKAYVPTIDETYRTMSILENTNFSKKIYDSNGTEIIFGSDGKQIENDDIEIVSFADVPDPESEELF